MKEKKFQKLENQLWEKMQARQDMMKVSHEQNYSTNLNNLPTQDENTTENTVYDSDSFIQQKNAESMYSRVAFINLVKRIKALETEVEEMADMIDDLTDTVKKQKDRIKRQKGRLKLLEAQTDEKIKQTNTQINTILEIIRNMGIAGGLFDDIYIKKKDLWKETKRLAKRRIREIRKYSQMVLPRNNGSWNGGNKQ